MSFVPVGKYLASIAVGGILYYMFYNFYLKEIISSFEPTGTVWRIFWISFYMIPLIVVLGGGIWLLMQMQKGD